MPSTRRQKAREKRSRQSDVMSDIDNLDLMLGSYARNEAESQLSQSEENVDLRPSERQEDSNPNGHIFESN